MLTICQMSANLHMLTVDRTFGLGSLLFFITLQDIWRNTGALTAWPWAPSCPGGHFLLCTLWGASQMPSWTQAALQLWLLWGRAGPGLGLEAPEWSLRAGGELTGQNLVNLIEWPGNQASAGWADTAHSLNTLLRTRAMLTGQWSCFWIQLAQLVSKMRY